MTPAPLFKKRGTAEKSFAEDGTKILKVLVHAGLGNRPVILRAHSLGGLLAKEILTQSSNADEDTAERTIFNNTEGVIFAATPHAGSRQARWRVLVPVLAKVAATHIGPLVAAAAVLLVGGATLTVSLSTRTWPIPVGTLVGSIAAIVFGAWMTSLFTLGPQALRLDPANPDLRDLTLRFRKACTKRKRTFRTTGFYEERNLWFSFLIVPSWSADPGLTDSTIEGIEANHIQICKGKSDNLKRRVEEYIDAACLGKAGGTAVFRQKLKVLVQTGGKEQKEAFNVLFNEEAGDKGAAEESFRPLLRDQLGSKFVPAKSELDLAVESPFFEDKFVLDLWHERTLADELRKLRKKAKSEESEDFHHGSAQQTVMPFYRSLRTIEHICTGDLKAPCYTDQSDRDLLIREIIDAQKKLDSCA